ncbi:MAG: M36 family metallopeptidase [Bacteroidia bacterium]
MIKKIILLLFTIHSYTNLTAQKNSNASYYPIDTVQAKLIITKQFAGRDIKQVENFANQNFSDIKKSISFKIDTITESMYGKHFLLQAYYNNEKIFHSFLKINTDLNGFITSILLTDFSTKTFSEKDFPNQQITVNYLEKNSYKNHIEKVWYFDGATLIPAWRIENIESVENNYELVVNENGVLYYRDLNAYHKALQTNGDSLVSMLIFNPDPLTRAGVNYGAPYIDNNDSDVPELNAQREQVNFPAYFDNGTFRLESNYVLITEFSSPATIPASSSTPSFHYSRSQNEFEDVNAFFHLNNYKNYLNSLGFTNLVNYQINVDAHGFNGADQSAFTASFSPPRLTFGEGGVDDAEDADVIIHEYGHAISHSAAPNTNIGSQRQALDEGFGDYLAASYSKSINNFRNTDVFTWDGHNQFWAGRNAASSKIYPSNLTGSIHANGEIWSSVLMQIHNSIGREKTDSILFQSMYNYSANMTMPQAATLFIQADSLLFNGDNYPIICNYFLQRGLVNSCVQSISEIKLKNSNNVRLLNSYNFTHQREKAIITIDDMNKYSINIYDVTGRQISNNENISNKFIIEYESLPNGMFIIEVYNSASKNIFRLIK